MSIRLYAHSTVYLSFCMCVCLWSSGKNCLVHMRSFVKINPPEMEKSFCRVLILVNHALVNVTYMSLNAIRDNKILAKISGFTVCLPVYLSTC